MLPSGISNWALDPAKMNRGLYVTRQPPTIDELTKTAVKIIAASVRNMFEIRKVAGFRQIYTKKGKRLVMMMVVKKQLCTCRLRESWGQG